MTSTHSLAVASTPMTLLHHRSMPLRRTPKSALHQFTATSASDLRVEHLHRASVWAASAVPSLGAFLGARLAATCESLALPQPTDLFCKRCCSFLQPGLNCSIQIKEASRKKLKLLAASGVQENCRIYICNFCGFHNTRVEISQSLKNENLIGSRSIKKLSEKSPYVTPGAFVKTPDTTPGSEAPFLQSLVNSTGSGRKRRRQGWLTLSERTKLQQSDRSPHAGRLMELAGAATITTMPTFESPEPQCGQSGNSVLSRLTKMKPWDIRNSHILHESETFEQQDIIVSNPEGIVSGPRPLVVEPPGNNCSQPTHMDLVEGCHSICTSEDMIDNQNTINDSLNTVSISDVQNKQIPKVSSEQILEQTDIKAETVKSHEVLIVHLPPEGACRTQEFSMVEMDIVGACHGLCTSEATIDNQNTNSSDSLKVASTSGDQKKQISKTSSEHILEQNDVKASPVTETVRSDEVLMVHLHPEDSFISQELSMVEMDLKDVPSSQEFSIVPEPLSAPGDSNYDDVEPLEDSESSDGFIEAKLSHEGCPQNNSFCEGATEREPDILSKDVDSETLDVSTLEISKISDMGMDLRVEIGDMNVTDLPKGPPCLIGTEHTLCLDGVKQLPEISKVATESEEFAGKAKDNRLETGLQCSLFPQEFELPCNYLHSKIELKDTAVQCSLSSQEVELPRKETSRKLIGALSLALKSSTRQFILSKKVQEARHTLYRRNLKHQLQAQLLEVLAYKEKIAKYKVKFRRMMNASRSHICRDMRLSRANPLWRLSNMVGMDTVMTSLKRQLRVIPKLKKQISDLSSKVQSLASLENVSDASTPGVNASESSDGARVSPNLEVSDPKVPTVSTRKSGRRTPDDAKAFHLFGSKGVTKEPPECIIGKKVPRALNKQDVYPKTFPEEGVEGMGRTTLVRPPREGDSEMPCPDIQMFDAITSQNLASVTAMGVDTVAELPAVENHGPKRVEALIPFKLAVLKSNVSNSPDSNIQSARRKSLRDNAVGNGLWPRFRNSQVKSSKAHAYLYKLGRKWRAEWRKSH